MQNADDIMKKVPHKADCKRVWKRYDMTCPRCQELAAGLNPRAGWSDHKRAFKAASIAAIRAHDCKKRGCGPVCTFGDW